MKTKIFVTALFILMLSALFMTKSVNAQDALLQFNVKVLKHLSTQVQVGAQVEYWKDGVRLYNILTGVNGIALQTAPAGTYDIKVYYPPKPNDGQKVYLLGHYHTVDETVTLSLGPNY